MLQVNKKNVSRSKLIYLLLKSAEYNNIIDEVSPSIADLFIEKYTNACTIPWDLAQLIENRFESIAEEAHEVRTQYNHIISNLIL